MPQVEPALRFPPLSPACRAGCPGPLACVLAVASSQFLLPPRHLSPFSPWAARELFVKCRSAPVPCCLTLCQGCLCSQALVAAALHTGMCAPYPVLSTLHPGTWPSSTLFLLPGMLFPSLLAHFSSSFLVGLCSLGKSSLTSRLAHLLGP